MARRGVRVEGVQSTRESLVDRAVTIKSGEAAGQSEATETERRLYRLGTFRSAAVRFEPVPSTSSEKTVAVDAVVGVQEARKYLLRYGLALSSEYEAVLDDHFREFNRRALAVLAAPDAAPTVLLRYVSLYFDFISARHRYAALYLQLMTDHHKGGIHMAEGCVAKCTVGVEKRLAARLAKLRDCSGLRGRDAPTAAPFCE